MINMSQLKENITKWVRQNTDTDNNVYWYGQNMPESSHSDTNSNIILSIDNLIKRQNDNVTAPNDSGITSRYGSREITLTIRSIYGSAFQDLSNLVDSLNNETVRDRLATNDIVFLRHGKVIDLTEVINSKIVEEAMCDVLLRIGIPYGDTITDKTSLIEHVEMESNVVTETETLTQENTIN